MLELRGLLFSVKIPQVISHEKVLVDCDAELEEFVKTMDILGPKLGLWSFSFRRSTAGNSRSKKAF